MPEMKVYSPSKATKRFNAAKVILKAMIRLITYLVADLITKRNQYLPVITKNYINNAEIVIF